MIAFGTIAGGAGASLTGGNFWVGAVTGLTVSSLNHFAHQGDGYEDVDQEDPPGQYEPKPSKFKGLNIDKKINDEYKSYANKRIAGLKKSIQASNKKINKIKSETAEIERSMSEASDGSGGDKGMGFGTDLFEYYMILFEPLFFVF